MNLFNSVVKCASTVIMLPAHHFDFWDKVPSSQKGFSATCLAYLAFALKMRSHGNAKALPLNIKGLSCNESIAFHCFVTFVAMSIFLGHLYSK